MWQKLMRTWLLGAAVTLAMPEGTLRAETNDFVDNIAGSSNPDAKGDAPVAVPRKNLRRYTGEPLLAELLADPICQALMHRDGVTPTSLATLIAPWRAS